MSLSKSAIKRMGLFWVFFSLISLPWITSFAAGSALKKATVEELSGEVVIRKQDAKEDSKATTKDVVQGNDIIRTGKKSRVELEFEDKSICRLGSNTIFSFNPETRDMAFVKGVALVHVPPGKGGARIATPAATAAINGDTLVVRATVMPDGTPATQFTAMSPHGGPTEGNIVVTLNGNPGQSFVLQGGQVAVIPQNATSISQIPRAEIDVATFAAKSPMMKDLPASAAQEMKVISVDQARAFESGVAVKTDYAIVGDQVVKADANGQFRAPELAPAPAPGGQAAPGTEPLPPGATRGADGTVTMSDGTKVQPGGNTVPAPGGSTSLMGPSTGGAFGAPTPLEGGFAAGPMAFSTFQDFTSTLAQINNPPPPPLTPPPGVLLGFFNGNNPVTLGSATFRVDSLGVPTVTGLSRDVDFTFVTDGVGALFSFDQLTLSGGTITVDVGAGKDLRIHTFNNSGGSAPLQITGNTTVAFTSGDASISFAAEKGTTANPGGNITLGASTSLTSAGTVDMIAPDGSVSLGATSTINTSSASAGVERDIIIHARDNITLGTLTASAGAGSGDDGGTILVTSFGTGNVTATNPITSNGGSSVSGLAGDGGLVNLTAVNGSVSLSAATSDILTKGGDHTGNGTAGNGGAIGIHSTAAFALISGNTINSAGGNETGGGAGGTGGTAGAITITGPSVSVPDGATILANGGSSAGTGGVSGKGGSISLTATAGAVSLVTGSDVTILDASRGSPSGGAVAGGGGTINLSATTTITVNDTGGAAGNPTLNANGTGGAINSNQTLTLQNDATKNP